MKKLLSLTLVLIMMLCVASPALAVDKTVPVDKIIPAELVPFDEDKAFASAEVKLQEKRNSVSPNAMVDFAFHAIELDAYPVVVLNGEPYEFGAPMENQKANGLLNPIFDRAYDGYYVNGGNGVLYPISYYFIVYVGEWGVSHRSATFNDIQVTQITNNGVDTSYQYYGYHFISGDAGLFRALGRYTNGVTVQAPWTIN